MVLLISARDRDRGKRSGRHRDRLFGSDFACADDVFCRSSLYPLLRKPALPRLRAVERPLDWDPARRIAFGHGAGHFLKRNGAIGGPVIDATSAALDDEMLDAGDLLDVIDRPDERYGAIRCLLA